MEVEVVANAMVGSFGQGRPSGSVVPGNVADKSYEIPIPKQLLPHGS
jgi:hypothetical protein